jgi:hypothetical protein
MLSDADLAMGQLAGMRRIIRLHCVRDEVFAA